MAVRDDFAAGEVLAAADLNDTFASKLPYSYGTATPSTTDSGFLWYDSNSTPAAPKFWDGAAFQALTSGKILQVVRDTDSTQRSTTSTSFVDATGMTVTITPEKSDSAIFLILTANVDISGSATTPRTMIVQITDSSNNAISGAETVVFGTGGTSPTGTYSLVDGAVVWGYATPATTSAVTYKVRFRSGNASNTVTFVNNSSTAQLFAIEVGA